MHSKNFSHLYHVVCIHEVRTKMRVRKCESITFANAINYNINLTPCQNNVEKFEMEYAYAKSAPFGKDLQNRQPDTQVKRTIRIFIKNRTK